MAYGNPDTWLAKIFGYTPKELYSERFYQERELPYNDLYKYKTHCNSIIVSDQKNHMKDLCKRVLKYLEQSEKWKENTNGYDQCILLNYWIYDKIAYYFGHHNTENINIAFSALKLIWYYLVNEPKEGSYYKKCQPLFDKILKHDDWDKRKELYDYCIDYDLIGPMCKSYDHKCMQYYEYIEKKSYLFEHFESICTSGENNCPHFYEKCKSKNPKLVLPTLMCHEKIKAQRDAAAEATANSLALQRAQKHQKGTGLHDSGIDLTTDTSQIGTKVGQTVLGVAPVLFAASALYRYTPLGLWIRNIGGNNPNNMNNVDGEMAGFFGNAQESGNMFFDGEENYISYQPM
ncbi:PIR Superfamily Protein [Plasmodium ovale wallikeri]|uniref:PIR Superfamily Protein n=1 Tax=Plasmodium ovale wallikeri TaxID=864142 RepID=A0A1A9AJ42_PLAOA|nr:PIR Superfamily Protein [Plasmodium ovale wallikeri]